MTCPPSLTSSAGRANLRSTQTVAAASSLTVVVVATAVVVDVVAVVAWLWLSGRAHVGPSEPGRRMTELDAKSLNHFAVDGKR